MWAFIKQNIMGSVRKIPFYGCIKSQSYEDICQAIGDLLLTHLISP